MKILSCDTSNMTASIALIENDRVLTEYAIHDRKTHSQKLLPMISAMLHMMEVNPLDIDAYAVAEGPGSFTGLRIGLVTMKTMAYAAGKPVIGIPTLEALAYTVPFFKGLVCPVMDARNKQAFCGFYQRETTKISRLDQDDVLHVEDLAKKLLLFNQDVLVVGDCAESFQKIILDIWKNENHLCLIIAAQATLFSTRAATIGLLASERLKNGQSGDPFLLEPQYMRVSQAEQAKMKKGNAT